MEIWLQVDQIRSKNHPDGKRVFEALNKGIRIMRESGEIEKFYRQAGFINASVKDWAIANSSMMEKP